MQDKVLADEMSVTGIKVRTKNSDEMNGRGRIAALWEKFLVEDYLKKIPNPKNGRIIAVYSNYQSDENGEYDVLIGMETDPTATPPSGMDHVKVPKNTYAKFTSNTGTIPGIVQELWSKIWDWNQEAKARSFQADLEIYDERATHPKEAQIDILISIRE